MKLRVTSITATDVGALISGVTCRLEDRLRPILEPKDYGGDIDQLAVFFVSVDADAVANERYCVANNRAGRYKDLLTGKMTRFLGISVAVDPRLVLSSSKDALPRLLETLFLDELKSPAYAFPKKFEHRRLVADVTSALAPE
jgi:hypothetical protein